MTNRASGGLSLVEIEGARVEGADGPLASSLTLKITGPRAVVVGNAAPLVGPLFGLARVASGRFHVLGAHLDDARDVAFAPLDPPLPIDLTPVEYVTWSARLGGLSPKDARRAASDACERAGLGTFATRKIGRIPLVPRRLVVLAHAASTSPRLLVADSPLAGLDPDSARYVLGALGRLVASRCAIVTTPRFDPGSPAEVLTKGADEVIVLAGERVLEQGAPSSIRTLWSVDESAPAAPTESPSRESPSPGPDDAGPGDTGA